MLSIMRKKAGSWILKILLAIIAIMFVFYFGFDKGSSNKVVQIATVNGDIITKHEYDKQYEALVKEFRNSMGENFNEEIIKSLHLEKEALDSLIERRLMLSEAEELNFEVTEEELDLNIVRMPAFQNGGRFDENKYLQVLRYTGITPEAFKEMQREALIIEKLRLFIVGSAKVSEKEARQWFEWENAEVNIDVVKFSPERYATPTITPEEIEAFYEQNKNTYITKPRINVQFIRFNPDDYRSMVEVTDEEIQEYYESNPEEFETPKSVEARHILVKVNPDADEEMVSKTKERALALMNRAKSGQDFATLAKEFSDGPNKDKGGILPVFQKGQLSRLKPLEEKAFSMKPGEISEPVRTVLGWHIIKVEKVNEAVVLPEKEAKKIIREKMLGERSKNKAYDEAEAVYDICLDVEELNKAAEQKDLKLTTTGFISETTPVKGVMDQDKFKSIAFKLLEGEFSDIHDLGDGFYILQTTKKISERIPELDEIKERVAKDLVKDKRHQKAAEDSRLFLEALKKGAAMDAEARRYNVRMVSTGFFKRNAVIPGVGYEKEISQAAFQLSSKRPLPENVLKGGNGYYVIRFRDRKEPGTSEFTTQKNDIMQRLLEQKKMNTFDEWLSQVKRDSEIEIEETYQKL